MSALLLLLVACADTPDCLPITGSCLPGQSGYSEIEAGCIVVEAEICTEAGCLPMPVTETEGTVGWECEGRIGEVTVMLEVADGAAR